MKLPNQNQGQASKKGTGNQYPVRLAGNESKFNLVSREKEKETCQLTINRLRCDQALPVCDSCVRRGDMMSCSYQHRRAGLQRHWPSSHSNSSSVQNRMDRLEQLVVTMMNQKEVSAADPSIDRVVSHRDVQASRYEASKEEVPQPNESTNSRMLRIDADYGNVYTVGEAHWSALLNEVREYVFGVSYSYAKPDRSTRYEGTFRHNKNNTRISRKRSPSC